MNTNHLYNLPINERLKLVEDLWESIASDTSDFSITSLQKEEIDKRLDAFAEDGNKGKDYKTVIACIKNKL